MDKNELLKMISKRLSTHSIAKLTNTSQTTVRYWIKKYKIDLNNSKENRTCICCDNLLSAMQVKYCSVKCKSKAHYNKYKNNTNSTYSQYKRGHLRKLKLIALFDSKCTICGYNKNLAALQFHHLRDKVFNVDIRRISNTKYETLVNEVNKCQLLCANCHSEHHNPHLDVKVLKVGFEPT